MSDDFTDALSVIAREVLGNDADVTEAKRGPVGNGQETWFCSVTVGGTDHRIVVRRSAVSGPLNWTDRAAEYSALAWLEPHAVPTPPVLHFEPDGGRLDRATIVMAHMPGEALGRVSQGVRDRLVVDLGIHLARLHAIDAAGFPGADGADMAKATTRQLEFWKGRYAADALSPIPLLGALLAWLRANQPSRAGPSVVLWGDPGPYNVLHVDGEVSALLDWELVHIGDPLEDLGAAAWSCRGVADPELLIAAYENAAGREIDREALRWFEAFAAVARAIMLTNGARSVVTSDVPRPSMMGLSLDLLPQLLNQAAEAAGWPPIESLMPAGDDAAHSSAAAALEPHVIRELADDGAVRGDDEYQSDLRPDVEEVLRGIATYLDEAVLTEVEDRFVRRNLKTISALLRVSALRSEHEATIAERRSQATDDFLGRLAAAGVDVSGGLEATSVRIESSAEWATHRTNMRRHLLTDQAMAAALLEPLRKLYG